MGIPAYFSHIVKQHKDIIKKFNKDFGVVDNLLMDCNSIVYDCIRSIDYIKDIKPTNTVYIAFDGVAPVAKLEQQRTRRYKSHFTNNVIDSFKNTKTSYWDTTNITPGTNFMNKLSKYIHNYFNDSRNFNVKNLIISTSTTEGEGEHKLFSDIRKDNDYINQRKMVFSNALKMQHSKQIQP